MNSDATYPSLFCNFLFLISYAKIDKDDDDVMKIWWKCDNDWLVKYERWKVEYAFAPISAVAYAAVQHLFITDT